MAPSTRTFHRTVITIEVLSEEPYVFTDLARVEEDITEGHCSGATLATEPEVVDGPIMARLLQSQGSDPDFFGLTADGSDSDL